MAALHSSFRDESSPIASQHRTTHSETTEVILHWSLGCARLPVTCSRANALQFRTSLLVKAAKVGDTDKVRRLLALNTEVSARRAPVPSLLEPYQAGLTPLLWAAHFGHVDVVRLLLADHRVNPLDTCAVRYLHWMGACCRGVCLVRGLHASPCQHSRHSCSWASRPCTGLQKWEERTSAMRFFAMFVLIRDRRTK